MIFMESPRGVVIEAFLPHFLYGTGIALAKTTGHLHLPLFLEWQHANTSAVANTTLAAMGTASWCAGRRIGNLFHGKFQRCTESAKQASYNVPISHLRYLLTKAWTYSQLSPLSSNPPRTCFLQARWLIPADTPLLVLNPVNGRKSSSSLSIGTQHLLPKMTSALGFCPIDPSPREAPQIDSYEDDGLVLLLRVVAPNTPQLPNTPFVLLDFVTVEALQARSLAEPVNAPDNTSAISAHMHYFCASPPKRLTAASAELLRSYPRACIVPVEFLEGLLRIARTHATPHQGAGDIYTAQQLRPHGFVSCCNRSV
eukprot:CAMPEP_0119345258 /NCGR_PEP_ID=MMETSP1333-20130426/107391_1 /TAXON_ID=418940 /ORGANISM="Scyphosphaera apsteinii, Strain RCC1455" /LENGTH=311 /DNA_ID=CAMNT_0007357717 /DNA_START=474 /DNA_END=1409 /DNA_ORIENTATION=-